MYQVKWFNKKKGYGFVVDETGTEYFCHHTDITVDGYKYLRAGEYVMGELVDMEGGKRKLSNIRAPVAWGSLQCQLTLSKTS